MLKQRLITALIALPLLLLLLSYGPHWAIILIFTIIVGFSTYEAAAMLLPRLDEIFGNLTVGEADSPAKTTNTGIYLCTVLGVVLYVFSAFSEGTATRASMVLGMLAAILIGAFSSKNIELAMSRVFGYLLCICYASLPWLIVWELQLIGSGSRYVILLLAIVWCGDTGAYFGGRFFGNTKLAPHMSPKKTREGAVAGLLGSVLGGFLINAFWGFSLASHEVVLYCSVAGGTAGQLGDLVESTLKRFSGVKDSGGIFPGHGGILDRVDGLVFAAPVVWAILYAAI